jgi:hypothetical protein
MDIRSIALVIFIGIGATAVMDLWLVTLARLGVPLSSFALIGRWVGHVARGRFTHRAIGQAAAVRGELGLGWFTHYAVGILYAAALVALLGWDWVHTPSVLPALGFGVATVLVPWFVMQPAMGAGLAASKTAAPVMNALRSLANHAVFGIGLYLAAQALRWAL